MHVCVYVFVCMYMHARVPSVCLGPSEAEDSTRSPGAVVTGDRSGKMCSAAQLESRKGPGCLLREDGGHWSKPAADKNKVRQKGDQSSPLGAELWFLILLFWVYLGPNPGPRVGKASSAL